MMHAWPPGSVFHRCERHAWQPCWGSSRCVRCAAATAGAQARAGAAGGGGRARPRLRAQPQDGKGGRSSGRLAGLRGLTSTPTTDLPALTCDHRPCNLTLPRTPARPGGDGRHRRVAAAGVPAGRDYPCRGHAGGRGAARRGAARRARAGSRPGRVARRPVALRPGGQPDAAGARASAGAGRAAWPA